MDQINHFLHNHPLILTELVEEREVFDQFHCSGCDESISGPIYGCSDCDFYLHKSCAELPKEIQNFFHPCPLLLKSLSYSYGHICDACSKGIFGFGYACSGRCDFDMHVKCALRPTIESEGEELIQHFTDWHALKRLVDGIGGKKYLEVRCGICNKLCCGSSNSCAYGCEECNFFVHYSCMSNIPRQINHLFHPSCPLLLFAAPFSHLVLGSGCASCGKRGPGLFFRCQKCLFQLDVECALLPTIDSKDADKIQHSAHQHPLALHGNMETEARCRACGENCSGPCFVCERCSFVLHRPYAVEREIHHPFHPLHPLTLSPLPPDPDHDSFRCPACGGWDDRFMLVYRCANCGFNLHTLCAKPKPTPFLIKYAEDRYNSDDEFYCDVCEEKRYKFESVYYCEECKFIAEIRCVISELLPSLTIPPNSIEGKIISRDEENFALEATIAKRYNEIAELREKEKPLEGEVQKLQVTLTMIKQRLEELETDNVLDIFRLNQNKEKKLLG
ncbi:hypothetical protein PTKIN_Ptkin04bG0213600 [Pterospermum kingtungense]